MVLASHGKQYKPFYSLLFNSIFPWSAVVTYLLSNTLLEIMGGIVNEEQIDSL